MMTLLVMLGAMAGVAATLAVGRIKHRGGGGGGGNGQSASGVVMASGWMPAVFR